MGNFLSIDEYKNLLLKQKKTIRKSNKGWREINGKRYFFRSSWEANYARWLEHQKEKGIISNWLYEPKTFWFDAIKRGTRSYLPDFQVFELNGSHIWHEVKGYLDAKSKTKLKRMGIYYPNEIVRLIDQEWFKQNKILKNIIPKWE